MILPHFRCKGTAIWAKYKINQHLFLFVSYENYNKGIDFFSYKLYKIKRFLCKFQIFSLLLHRHSKIAGNELLALIHSLALFTKSGVCCICF